MFVETYEGNLNNGNKLEAIRKVFSVNIPVYFLNFCFELTRQPIVMGFSTHVIMKNENTIIKNKLISLTITIIVNN